MKFNDLTIVVDSVTTVFQPYDRGANGAFVWRETGSTLHAPRVIASATTNDAASDKYLVQLNQPRLCTVEPAGCEPVTTVKATDIVKAEFRFTAETSSADRSKQLDELVKLIQEFRTAISLREKIYA